jgi:hypothetical protein
VHECPGLTVEERAIMTTTPKNNAKLSPERTMALTAALLREVVEPSRRRMLRYRLTKPHARELHRELEALCSLYYDATLLVQWVRRLAAQLPAGHPARPAIAAQLRAAREKIDRIRHSREEEGT